MGWREYAGAAAGGTLGFILGDVPGATLGALNGAGLTRIMERGRKRTRVESPVWYGSAKRRSGSRLSVRWKSTSRSRSGRSQRLQLAKIGRRLKYRNQYPTLRRATMKGRQKKTKFKHKRIRISNKFRKKVRKVVQSIKNKGFFQWTSYAASITSNGTGTPSRSVQEVIMIRNHTLKDLQNPQPTQISPLFSPSLFASMCNVLWANGAGPSNVDTVWDSCVGGNDVGLFQYAKIPVIKSWMKYCIKNNTTNTAEIKMYICKPKSRSAIYRFLDPTKDTTGDIAYMADPLQDWLYAIRQGTKTSFTQFGVRNRNPLIKGLHTTQETFTMDTDPRQYPYFNQWWKTDVVKMKIYPGQCVEKIVKGPEDIMIDMSKLWKTGPDGNLPNSTAAVIPPGWDFTEIQPYCRFVFFVYKPELACVNVGAPGTLKGVRQFEPSSTTDAQAIVWEQKMYAKLGKPDQIGRWNEATYELGDILVDNNHRDVFFIQNSVTDATGTYNNIQNSGVSSFT